MIQSGCRVSSFHVEVVCANWIAYCCELYPSVAFKEPRITILQM